MSASGQQNRLVITIRPSDDGLLRVEDAFQQVLGALKLFEQAQRSLGNPHAAFVWRLEKASTEAPFTVVAVADPLDPAIDVTPQVIRAKALVADGVRNLVARAEPPPWLPRAELEIVAQRAGWQIVEFYEDAGISGSRGRDRRPAFDRLVKDATRRRFDLIAAWLVDRLGRSLQDLVGFLSEIHGAGVDLYLHRQAIDTSTPAGKAMFQMLGVFAEFEKGMIVERVHAGIARARANGKRFGRPAVKQKVADAVRSSLAAGLSIRKSAA